jgi:hypothetical protein
MGAIRERLTGVWGGGHLSKDLKERRELYSNRRQLMPAVLATWEAEAGGSLSFFFFSFFFCGTGF